ncbi:MAG: Fic family protein [Bacteroidetes bacterium]|nr:Fic family protein [Bacteroidota bacterium]
MKNSFLDRILSYLTKNPGSSSRAVHEYLHNEVSYATVKRLLTKLEQENLIFSEGNGKATRYRVSPTSNLLAPFDMEAYFKKEIDERDIKEQFNFELIPMLAEIDLFTNAEQKKLDDLQSRFVSNISKLDETTYKKEMERLAIDLSWKSSQIEGNTYSLLETERLLTKKETAAGKPQSDAIMLLNHKEAINFILKNKDYVSPLSVHGIEDIHSILIEDLGIDRNIRQRRVGISGTNYRPLDNEHQIREALSAMCELVNSKPSVFEKALLALVLLSYIQAFVDGNKRTARIISNAVLVANNHCPISFRTVDPVEYKKAMLVFYEQHNITPVKDVFIAQYQFAVDTYF